MSNNAYKVTILPNGAIPTEMLSGGKEHNSDTAVQSSGKRTVEDGQQVHQLIEQVILLKKQIRGLTRERDAYKQYVPPELLNFGTLLKYTPSSTGDEKAEAGQITDDE